MMSDMGYILFVIVALALLVIIERVTRPEDDQ